MEVVSTTISTTLYQSINIKGTWNAWYTIYCYMEKRRTFNSSFIEVVRINISSLENCDRLDENYITMKTTRIQNETSKKVETTNNELKSKLAQIGREKAIMIQAATSFAWLAILMIFLLFLVSILIDCQKLISYLKKCYSINTMGRLNNFTPQKEETKTNSVFKQVIQKD
jgi:hypothetical protein